jgi:hypothetical protein
MPQKGFVIAMAANVALAEYARPTVTGRRIRKWMIVSRLGTDNEYLTISTAGAIAGGSDQAPLGLVPINTMLGILLSAEEADESIFLLVRKLPAAMQVAGSFFPSDGYARIHGRGHALRLRSSGRHSHSVGRQDGREIRQDVPDPSPNAKWTMAWHLDGVRRPWTGEFIPAAENGY